jgi:hypothetical protein
MRKPSWSCLLIGLIIVVVTACKPISEDEKDLMTAEFAPSPTDAPIEANQPATLSIPTKSLVTVAPPPAPTAAPTSPPLPVGSKLAIQLPVCSFLRHLSGLIYQVG